MMKQLFNLFLVVTVLLAGGTQVKAVDRQGSCGSGVTYYHYSIANGDGYNKLLIQGTGSMEDYSSSGTDRPWNSWIRESALSVVIKSGVTGIGNYAFLNCTGIFSFESPNKISKIGTRSFSYCRNLIDFESFSNLTTIGEGAFEYSGIQNAKIPSGVTRIEKETFSNCKSLSNLTLPSGLKYIGEKAFYNCDKLDFQTLPTSLTGIGSYAFYNCSSLTQMTIPANVTSIGDYAFRNCSSLRKVRCLSTTPPNLGTGAFPTGTEIHVKSGYGTSYKASSGWSGYTIIDDIDGPSTDPDTPSNPGETDQDETSNQCGENATFTFDRSTGHLEITGTGEMYYFWQMSSQYPWNDVRENIKSISIGEGITNIGYESFADCMNLQSIKLPSTLESISGWAFHNCMSLTSIIIPAAVKYVGRGGFEGCINLQSVTCLRKIPCRGSEFHTYGAPNYTVHVLKGSKKAYAASDGWNNCSIIDDVDYYDEITDGIEIVGDEIRGKCGDNTSFTLYLDKRKLKIYGTGSVMTSDTPWAPYSLLITDIEIEDGVTNSSVFSRFYNLENISLPASVVSIDRDAFLGCTKLSSIILPKSLTNIDDWAFDGCQNLLSVNIPKGVKKIGESSFRSCKSLVSITIPSAVESIGASAFAWCEKLSSITCLRDTPPTLSSSSAFNYIQDGCVLHVKPGCKYAYYYADGWDTFEIMDDAVEGTIDGICGPDVSFEFDKASGTLVLSGTGDMFDYQSEDDVPWYQYRDEIKNVEIGNGVTNIGERAFSICEELYSVVIPNSVSNIGARAFQLCTSLPSISIPNSVTNIGVRAFGGCLALSSITVPNSVKKIEDGAFTSCTNISSVIIGDAVATIGEYAFANCSSLLSVTSLNTTPPTIAATTFIDIPSNCVFHIKPGCKNLYSYRDNWSNFALVEDVAEGLSGGLCGDNVTYILDKNNGLLTISGTGRMTDFNLRSEPWYDDRYSIRAVNIKYGVTHIGNSAFDHCSMISSVTIPTSVTSIGEYAFDNCESLTSVSIPNKVTSIGDYAFTYCESLDAITIPKSVTTMGSSVFYQCKNLKSVTSLNTTPPTIGKSCFLCVYSGCVLHVKPGCKSAYEASYYWSYLNIVEDADDTVINGTCGINVNYTLDTKTGTLVISGSGDMYDFDSLYEIPWYKEYRNIVKLVEIQNGVTSIGDYAFYGCSKLTNVTIPNSVTSIGSSAFSGCSGLTNIRIPNSVTSIGNNAFRECSSLTYITIPNSVTSIGNDAFNECVGLTNITISNSVTSIGDDTFYKCSSLTNITIPNSATSIGNRAFYGCM